MFPAALSPICDMKGDDTVNIISTPHFPVSPLLKEAEPAEPAEPAAESKVSRRLFEDSSVSYSSEWTTDSSSNDWTTDSEEEPESEFRWSATP
jgi:hypothetical protein